MSFVADFTKLSKRSYVLPRPSSGLPWVLQVSVEHWAPTFCNPRPRRENCFLAYVQEGTLRIEGRKDALDAGPGMVAYAASRDRGHALRAASPRGVRLLRAIVNTPESTDPVAPHLGPTTRLFYPADGAAVEVLMHCMLGAAAKGYPASSDIVAHLLLSALHTLRQENVGTDPAARSNQQLFNRCREYMTHHYLDIPSISAVAAQFDISHAWLCHLFKTYEGRPPHQFLLQRKMTYALYELQHHDRAVGDVAEELGFADRYSFSKAFKRVMGHSPAEARTAREQRPVKLPPCAQRSRMVVPLRRYS